MRKPFALCGLFSLLPVFLWAQLENNISISNAIENYEFVQGNAENPVLIKQTNSTTFKCNGYRVILPFAEFYDDKSTIDDVKIFVDGVKPKGIVPQFSYYSISDYFYSDAHICYFNLPLEKKGSESRVEIAKTILDPRYFNSIYFDDEYLTENKIFSIKVPSWVQMEIKEYNFPAQGITKNVQQTADATIYTYTIKNVPSRKRNKYAPGPTYLYPHILLMTKSATPPAMKTITYFKTLQQQYEWYHSLVQQIGNDEGIFKTQVQEIIKDKTTDKDKVEAIYNWVQNNIRYIAFEDGIAGFKPEKAQEVFRKKYGDCKGMANLTKAMLKTLGYDARLCWLGTNHIAYDYSTPSLAVDNHMICAVKLNGKFTYLDATEKFIGFGEYAERIQGRQVLIEDGEKYVLERIPVETNMQNVETTTQLLKIDSGKIAGSVILQYKGESKEYMLSEINSISSQKKQTSLLQYLSNENNNYKIENLKTSSLQDWNNDLSIQYDLKIENAITDFGNEKYLDIDSKKELANFKIDASRGQDFCLPYKMHIQNITELTLPDGFLPEQLPPPLSIKNDTYSFQLEYNYSGNKLTYKKELQLLKPSIAVNQFAAWNADITRLSEFYNEQIILKKN